MGFLLVPPNKHISNSSSKQTCTLPHYFVCANTHAASVMSDTSQLSLPEYRRYGRQMILERFGLAGTIFVPLLARFLSLLFIRPAKASSSIRCCRWGRWSRLPCPSISGSRRNWFGTSIRRVRTYLYRLTQARSVLLITTMWICRIYNDKYCTQKAGLE